MSEPNLFLKDLNPFIESLTMTDQVFLVRKLSGHVLTMSILGVLTGTNPAFEVCWTRQRALTYKLDLKNNLVIALETSQKHRTEMKVFWEVYEPHRIALIKLWESETAKNKKKRK